MWSKQTIFLNNRDNFYLSFHKKLTKPSICCWQLNVHLSHQFRGQVDPKLFHSFNTSNVHTNQSANFQVMYMKKYRTIHPCQLPGGHNFAKTSVISRQNGNVQRRYTHIYISTQIILTLSRYFHWKGISNCQTESIWNVQFSR